MKLAKDYYLPTPIFWRKVGDALLACSTLITSYSIMEDYKWVAIASLLSGVVGKFLSNLFTVDATPEPPTIEVPPTPPTE